MASFLLEIGTEELPPAVIEPATRELQSRILNLLRENEIQFGATEIFYTPRRIALRINELTTEKPATEVEFIGPPKKAGFDAAGNPTKTALGFASAHGKDVNDLYIKHTPKGEYLCVRRRLPAVTTVEILAQHLPNLITTLPFPRTMRWDQSGLRFSRPLRRLTAIFDSEIVKFSVAQLPAGNQIFGHRNFTTSPLILTTPLDYEPMLEKFKVIVAPIRRQNLIIEQANQLVKTLPGEVVPDNELLNETVNTTEFPEPLLGSFPVQYLQLPKPVLVTALRMHQRCFSVQDSNGKLLPYFIVVINTPDCDRDLVRRWYERAIESRLRDALFFVNADLKSGLEPLVEEEKRVIWIEGLGSYYDKTVRLRELCRFLSNAVSGIDQQLLDRAAYLCKADLLTNLVREKEFTSLQGVVGGIYARLLGEDDVVVDAIAEHYLPKSTDDQLPKSNYAGLLSIADKLDNIIATYLTGNKPTGSEDPFGVRRQATGILAIILQNRWPIDLSELVKNVLDLFAGFKNIPLATTSSAVMTLFQDRLGTILSERGINYDVANAVLKAVWHIPSEALMRAESIEQFRQRKEFEQLVIGQKRVTNILRGRTIVGLPEEKELVEPAEQTIFQQVKLLEPKLKQHLQQKDYTTVLKLLLSLRPAIDRLFDEVLIMCDDEKIRNNRLRLLHYIRSLFAQFADLSEIVLEGAAK